MTADPSPLLDIGHIAKPHGLKGQVLVALTTSESSRLTPGSVLRADDRDLVVVAADPHHHRWIVTFRGVDTREAAEALAGQALSASAKAEADDGDPGVLWAHELIGAHVIDGDGRDRGAVVAIVANPASDLLELSSGALVPLRFVVGGIEGTDDGPVVRVDPPEGLFD
jgi:16S rRNA processing protein RimM